MTEKQIKYDSILGLNTQRPWCTKTSFEMDGEVVERADPHIGLLHRGTEKL